MGSAAAGETGVSTLDAPWLSVQEWRAPESWWRRSGRERRGLSSSRSVCWVTALISAISRRRRRGRMAWPGAVLEIARSHPTWPSPITTRAATCTALPAARSAITSPRCAATGTPSPTCC